MSAKSSSSSSSSSQGPYSSSKTGVASVEIDYTTQIIVPQKEWNELQSKNKSPPQIKAEGEAASKKRILTLLGWSFLLLVASTVYIIAFTNNGYEHSDKLINIITTMVGGLLGYAAGNGKSN